MSTEDRLKQMIGSADSEGRASEAEWNQFAQRAHGALLTRRAGMAIGTLALVAVAVFAAVTLRPTNDVAPAPPARTPDATAEPSATPEPEPTVVDVPPSEQELWFVQGEKLSWGTTVAGGSVSSEIAGDQPPDARIAFWLELLLQGTMGPDQEAGATTTIPAGTELLRVMRNGTTSYVDLSAEFESGGGSLSMQMRVAQVVYTATQFPGIESVRIMIEGEMVDAIGGEGFIVSDPLTRRDFQDLAPNIVVESPRPGEVFANGDSVSGFANVFEATLQVRLVDENGTVLFEDFTTATCGTGCWGDFEIAVEPWAVDHAQDGRLEVFTYSAEDGSERDVVSIPVHLAF
jgi:germination protein M